MKREPDTSQIKRLYETWEREETRRREQQDFFKELFSYAKSHGFNTKALRAAFNERFLLDHADAGKIEKRQTDSEDIDLYLAALSAPSHACEDTSSHPVNGPMAPPARDEDSTPSAGMGGEADRQPLSREAA